MCSQAILQLDVLIIAVYELYIRQNVAYGTMAYYSLVLEKQGLGLLCADHLAEPILLFIWHKRLLFTFIFPDEICKWKLY